MGKRRHNKLMVWEIGEQKDERQTRDTDKTEEIDEQRKIGETIRGKKIGGVEKSESTEFVDTRN